MSTFICPWTWRWPRRPSSNRPSSRWRLPLGIDESWKSASDEQLRESFRALRLLKHEHGLFHERQALVDRATGIVYEAAKRSTGIELYDVQLQAIIALVDGQIVEMQTGEGKTLVSGSAACVLSRFFSSVHVATTNDYLASRDAEIVSPILEFLQVTLGVVDASKHHRAKQSAYDADITYGAASQFGFDYLRDQVTLRSTQPSRLGMGLIAKLDDRPGRRELLQRSHACMIVDEADSVLLDEASTPLILSGLAEEVSTPDDQHRTSRLTRCPYLHAQEVANALREGTDYLWNESTTSVELLAAGLQKVYQSHFDRDQLELRRPWDTYVHQALFARLGLQRDEHYVIVRNQVQLVDRSTGRIVPDRTLSNGLHQTVEAKEGVPITEERTILSRTSRQSFMRKYEFLAGLTGTAIESATEIAHFYGMDVISIPSHRPTARRELRTRYFHTQQDKLVALLLDIRRRRTLRQPVLIGTETIRQSLQVEALLRGADISCQVLNGLQDAQEAEIIAQAGESGSVTVATNMAGRGTDIRLDSSARRVGGLHVVSLQRHTSRRIDRQLVGRCGRQGDPGSYQFLLSAEDELLLRHAPQIAAAVEYELKNSANPQDGVSNSKLDAAVLECQQRLEDQHFAERVRQSQHEHWLDQVRAFVS